MPESLLTFQRFNDLSLATDFAERLEQLGIKCEIDNQTIPFDATFANNPLDNDIRIKLKPRDFAKANDALDDYYKSQLYTVDKDYYLFEFTDRELMEIIEKPDEWGRLDYQLAQKILKDKGKEVKPAEAELFKEKRLTQLSKTEKMSFFWVYLGYVSAILGGLIGIIIALLLMYAKKTLPNGQSVYIYGPGQRSHGKLILIISVVSFVIWAFVNWGNFPGFSGIHINLISCYTKFVRICPCYLPG